LPTWPKSSPCRPTKPAIGAGTTSTLPETTAKTA
jgi:hypothetical protein